MPRTKEKRSGSISSSYSTKSNKGGTSIKDSKGKVIATALDKSIGKAARVQVGDKGIKRHIESLEKDKKHKSSYYQAKTKA